MFVFVQAESRDGKHLLMTEGFNRCNVSMGFTMGVPLVESRVIHRELLRSLSSVDVS